MSWLLQSQPRSRTRAPTPKRAKSTTCLLGPSRNTSRPTSSSETKKPASTLLRGFRPTRSQTNTERCRCGRASKRLGHGFWHSMRGTSALKRAPVSSNNTHACTRATHQNSPTSRASRGSVRRNLKWQDLSFRAKTLWPNPIGPACKELLRHLTTNSESRPLQPSR